MKKIVSLEDIDLSQINFNYFDIIDGNFIRDNLKIFHFDMGFICNSDDYAQPTFQNYWNNFIDNQHENIEKIYNVLQEQYNPLDNYNGETTTTYGKQKETISLGERVTDFSKGKEKNTVTVDKRKSTLGGGTDTVINSTANSESTILTNVYNADNKTDTTVAQRINQSDSYVDTSENDAFTDTTTNYSVEDTNTKDAYTITENKHGNLGVTQSQTMVQNEIYLRIKNNFHIIITKMFVDNYLLFV